MMPAPFRIDTAFHPPVFEPRESRWLPVGDGHELYWEEIGPRDGTPVLVLHGGPGGATRASHRRLLDPTKHRGILFHQRGAGNSRFEELLRANTAEHLVADIERIRIARGIERWTVIGGSWGATLALLYAQTHPERTVSLVVSGMFLGRPIDFDWFWNGVRHIYPDVIDARDAWLPEESGPPREAFRSLILGDDIKLAREAAAMISHAEAQIVTTEPLGFAEDPTIIEDRVYRSGQILSHFDANDYFVGPNKLLDNIGRLSGIPGAIIVGRADLCTPPGGAYDLHKAWPESDLTIVPNAGHKWVDEMLGWALVPAIARMAALG